MMTPSSGSCKGEGEISIPSPEEGGEEGGEGGEEGGGEEKEGGGNAMHLGFDTSHIITKTFTWKVYPLRESFKWQVKGN